MKIIKIIKYIDNISLLFFLIMYINIFNGTKKILPIIIIAETPKRLKSP